MKSMNRIQFLLQQPRVRAVFSEREYAAFVEEFNPTAAQELERKLKQFPPPAGAK